MIKVSVDQVEQHIFGQQKWIKVEHLKKSDEPMVRSNSGTNLKCMQTVSSIHLHQVILRLMEQVELLKKSDEPNG
jgi:hypothetical protein